MSENVVMERALIVMAVCLVVQTIGMSIAAVAAAMAWRRTKLALDLEMVEMRTRLDRVSNSVEDAAHAFREGVTAVHSAVDGTREVLKTAVTAVGNPKAALAMTAVRGWQWWRRTRAERRARLEAPQPKLWVPKKS
jgi:hypothetical protein